LTSAARGGRDLVSEEKESRAAAASRLTVEQLIAFYVRRRVTGRLRTAKDIERRLIRALAPIRQMHAADVRRSHMRELLNAVADQGIEREAEKRRQTIGAMFRWALSQDMVEIDPTSGLASYDPGTPRDRTLTIDEIETFWAWLAGDNMPPHSADVLRLQLLLGARCGEIGGLRVEEIDQQSRKWTLPAARSKNGRPRITPLVGMAREIIEVRLRAVKTGPLFITETGQPLSASHIGHHLLQQQNKLPIAKFCTHDLRRSAVSLMAEMGLPLDVVAALVGHESSNRDTRTLVKHYVHTDLLQRKTAVLAAWDQRMLEIVSGAGHVDNVTQLKPMRNI